MDSGALQAIVHRVSKSPTQLSFTHTHTHTHTQRNRDMGLELRKEFETKTCILSRVKQITSPGWMHETSAQAWCTGKTLRDGGERVVGGGIEMGNTCNSMADSCQCMTKPTTIL